MALVVALLQSPGRIAADTKLDLTADPIGFLGRASHLWSSQAPLGQVQNQAYGYFFPHGAFFALGEVIAMPAWITQRIWWALLVTIGFVGIVRLCEALHIGSPGSRLIAGLAFVISPRVLTTLGSISSETLPMTLAPWVLTPVVIALDHSRPRHGLRWLAFASGCAVALMGAVNAVATVVAVLPAIIWWLAHLPIRRGPGTRRWLVFSGWWALAGVLACIWWIVPLAILSRVSPPFLDFIESSRATTEWVSLPEVLRGTSSWTPFVSPERIAGSALVTMPAAVLATGVVAAAGLAGLAMRRMPWRAPLVVILFVGTVAICVGFAGELSSPISETVRTFLDGSGASLRNVHKFEPLIRIPVVLGIAHLIARAPLPPRVRIRTAAAAFAHPERSAPVAATIGLLVAVVAASSLVWTANLAPAGTYTSIPDYWKQTARWLDHHRGNPTTPARALVVPGSPFADQLWGLTRDEPLQALASTPWAVRDAIPLVPPGAIRALDSVQRDIAAGRPSDGLANTLAQQGIRYVVLRADLDPQRSRSARPILARHAIADSPGLVPVATFGPEVGPTAIRGVIGDDGLRPPMRAVTVYEVRTTDTFDGTGPALADLDAMPRVDGGPEALAGLEKTSAPQPFGPALLSADARRAGVAPASATGSRILTDTPADRETDFGRVDDHSSAIRSPDDRRRTLNAAPDYPVDGQPLTQGRWTLDGRAGEVSVQTSGSASDATQPGQTSPANSAAAAFDGDPDTSWVSSGLDSAVGQWMRVDFTTPQSNLVLTLTPAQALGPDVTSVLVSTEAGTTVAQGLTPGVATSVAAPSAPTRWISVRAIGTADGTAGNQFALSQLSLRNSRTGADLDIAHQVVLPETTAGQQVSGWYLGQELGPRSACVPDQRAVRCSAALSLSPEQPGTFDRVLSVPQTTTVTPTVLLDPMPGSALDALTYDASALRAVGPASVLDPRANAQAAVDGDDRTTWIAPAPDGQNTHDEPTLEISLPAARRIDGLRLTPPVGGYPAAPTEVAVDLGSGRQVRSVGRDGVITLDPATTDHLRVTVLKTAELLDVNSLGFAAQAPAGIAEVTPLDHGSPVAPTSNPDRTVTLACGLGPTLHVGRERVNLSVQTTAARLRSGQPVRASVCPDQPPLTLPAGEADLTLDPTAAFTVDSLSLDTPGPAAGTPRTDTPARLQPVAPTQWSSDTRSVDVTAASRDRVLIVPESTNTGWHARLDRSTLRPITVNGWQQGWIVPAGASGTVTLTYPLDTPYRWSILLGLIACALLLVVTAFGPRGRRCESEPAQLIHAPIVGGVGVLAASWLLCGWVGLVVAVIVAAVVWRTRSTAAAVVLTGAAMTLSALLLAHAPWHSSHGYAGFSWWTQLPALVALPTLGWRAVIATDARPPDWPGSFSRRSRSARSRSRARSARRNGSSTIE